MSTPDDTLHSLDELARRRRERASTEEQPLRERVRDEARRNARRNAAIERARRRAGEDAPPRPFGDDGAA